MKRYCILYFISFWLQGMDNSANLLFSEYVSPQKLNVNSLKALYQMLPDTPITQDIEWDESINEPLKGDPTQQTLLHKLVQTDKQWLLLEKLCSYEKINKNPLDKAGRTPLFYCCSYQTAFSLLRKGWTDINIQDYQSKTVLDYYLDEFPCYLQSSQSPPDFFPIGIERGNPEITCSIIAQELIDTQMRQNEKYKISLFRKLLYSQWQGEHYNSLLKHFIETYKPSLSPKQLQETEKQFNKKTMTNLMPLQELYKKLYSQANPGWLSSLCSYLYNSQSTAP